MKKLFAIVVLSTLGLVSFAFASDVTDVALSYDNGATTATIYVDGPIRFSHEPVEAKEGKPFRVLVDVLSAEHHLAVKDYSSLPNCRIQSIRTSQYSVTPEKVVRLVFDLDKETIYRVTSDSKSIKLHFEDKAHRTFDRWLASTSVKSIKATKPILAKAPKSKKPVNNISKSAANTNKVIEKDRQVSLAAKVKAPAPKPAPPKKWTPTVTASKSAYGPEFDSKLLTADLPKKAAPKQIAKAPVKKVAPKQIAKAPVKKVAPKQIAKAPVKKVAPKQIAKAPVKKSSPKQIAKAPVKKAAPIARAEVKKEDKSKQRATSRFRRNPTGSKKIRGTLVAEFPKRLVIKYKARARRDPFETLINESKTYDNPIDGRVPNVEGLKLVGIIESETGTNQALFEDIDNYGYILKAGDKVRKGYVLRVENDRVYFQIFEYGWSRTVALNIDDN